MPLTFNKSGVNFVVLRNKKYPSGVYVTKVTLNGKTIWESDGSYYLFDYLDHNDSYCVHSNPSVDAPSSVIIPSKYNNKNVTGIDYGFSDANIMSISIPNGITWIGNNVFNNCSITNLIIPDSVTEINTGLAQSCPNLDWVVLPSGISTFGTYCFKDSPITKIYYNGTETQWNNFITNIVDLGTNQWASDLKGVDRYYYKAQHPQEKIPDDYPYWRYEGNVPTQLKHYYVETTTQPTCTSTGRHTYTCSDSKCNFSYYDIIPATEHECNAIPAEATCEEAAHTLHQCANCLYSYKDNYKGEPLGHKYKDEITTQPTCLLGGITTHTCTRTGCDSSYTTSIKPLGHAYNFIEYNATCTTAAYRKYECGRCSHFYTEETGDALGHKFTTAWAKDNDNHWHVCQNSGCTEISDKAAHSGGKATCTEKAKCTACGQTYGNVLEHVYVITSSTPATCTENGVDVYTCKLCGDSYELNNGYAFGHTPGAEATCTTDQICTVCKIVLKKAIGHEYGVTEHAATCTEAAYNKYKCVRCPDSYTVSKGEPLGHNATYPVPADPDVHTECSRCGITLSSNHVYNQDSGVTCRAATCEDNRTHFKECVCGYNPRDPLYVVEIAKTATGHNYNKEIANSDYLKSPATCTTAAVYWKSCVCGKKSTSATFTSGSPNGHDYKNVGTADIHAKCSVCEKTTSTHVYDQSVTLPVYKKSSATCTSPAIYYCSCECGYSPKNDLCGTFASGEALGHTEQYVGTSDVHTKCSVCEEILSSTHKYDQLNTDSKYRKSTANCTSPAIYYKSCKCGYYVKSNTFESGSKNLANHLNYIEVYVGTADIHSKYGCCDQVYSTQHDYSVDSGVEFSAATCTANSKNYKKCACGYNPKSSNYVVEVKDSALGHDWLKPQKAVWKEYTTCEVTRLCSRDYSHTQTATATGVNIEHKTTLEATCMSTGTRVHTAKFSGEYNWANEAENISITETLNIDSNAHIFDKQYTNLEPSYSWTGSNGSYTCTATRACGHNTDHKDTATATVSSKEKTPATCTTMGWTTYTATFTQAWAAKQTQDVQDIPATGHTEVPGGTSGVHTKCSTCGATISSTHNLTNKATYNICKECSCGYKTTNHSMTNTGTGATCQTCSECGYKLTLHSYTEDSGVQYTAATCTEKRKNYAKCSTCGYNPKSANSVVEVGSALGHRFENTGFAILYEWTNNGGFYTCTASRACGNGCGTSEKAQAEVTKSQVGVKTIYTAEFSVTWATTQTKIVI